ncbi:hypothetical protein BAUCODRAFT_61324 [Baudoinia panamericana UAMH 10762]|uniref:Nuclear pore complex protein n=1 Tax=Baudoinia panamericana (strain UAMH 10762) TaxID=717646 RepID=M2M194_BAUPA|nr:uncharacterized protein BAUCODRAFT_61324 [Baudoinia panamericana UAMH 10762]EMD00818.1 hypothetical protein BAUCODRAFT_61324 [Baudoinia panamericana UAMH 10762]
MDEAMDSLRDVADKVGDGVEQFAEELDRYLKELSMKQSKFEAAKDVAEVFKDIAASAASSLERDHKKQLVEQLQKEWSDKAALSTQTNGTSRQFALRSGVVHEMKAEKVQELRKWQQEADIWQLFWIMLDFHYNHAARRKEIDDQLANMPPPHRYAAEKELWERFLMESDTAKERSLVKQWLEQAADHQDSDLHAIVEELERKSGAGKGLWNRGWLSTRERIKGEKRIRSWPSPSDSVQPQIRSTASSEMLITALDPDAPTRQQCTVEKPDAYFERAMWIACWEMLRRGKSWEEILKWCEEHNEGWRALVLAPAVDSGDALSNAAWRKMCYLASESGCSNDYEAAVYGLLGGNLKAVKKVCRTVHDHLFAYYTCVLVRHFDKYLEHHHPSRIASLSGGRFGTDEELADAEQEQRTVTALVSQLRETPSKSSEAARAPLKIIESYLLTNEVESLATTVGTALSDIDYQRSDKEDVIHHIRTPPEKVLTETAVAVDYQALRIVATMYIVVRSLEYDTPSEETLLAEENVVIAYAQAIRTMRKRLDIFVYASRLEHISAILTVARMLPDVTQPDEQRMMINLMREYKLDITAILQEQLGWTLASKLSSEKQLKKPLRMLENCEVNNLHPGQRITESFLDGTMTEDDMAILRCLQWFQMVPGHWHMTFSALAEALRGCLMAGRLACAMAMCQEMSCEIISMQKSHSVIQREVNIMDKSQAPDDPDSDEALEWEVLRRQARTYYELEQMVHAIVSLAHWAEVERPFTSAPRQGSSVPQSLRQAKAALDEAMQPLLAGILQHPETEKEQKELEEVRVAYLPEIILAYNSALYTAGPTISRDAYIESMDLSVAVADERNGLAEAFTKAGRMRELVTSFAQASKLMLVMKANGRPRKANKIGKDLGIWEIGPQGAAAAEDSSDE